jgi:hypothetical protein
MSDAKRNNNLFGVPFDNQETVTDEGPASSIDLVRRPRPGNGLHNRPTPALDVSAGDAERRANERTEQPAVGRADVCADGHPRR